MIFTKFKGSGEARAGYCRRQRLCPQHPGLPLPLISSLHPKQYHQMFHIFMILIEVLHPPSTPTLKVAANESEMRPHNYGLQFGFRPTNRNPEPLKYRWSSRVSPPLHTVLLQTIPQRILQSDCGLTKYLQRFFYSRSYTNTLRTFAVKMHLNRTKPRFLNFQKFSLYPSFNEFRTQNVV